MPARSHLWPDPRVKPPYGAAEIDRGHPLTQHLHLHWVMNEGGGGIVLDRVRNQYGTLSGTTKPAWRASAGGLGLEFNGTTSYVVNQTVLNTPRVTVAAQFRVPTLPGATIKQISSFAEIDGSGSFDKRLSISATTANRVDWFVYDGASKIATDSSVLVANQTYTIVGTADGTTSRLYRDGVQTGSIAAGSTYTGYTFPNIFAGGSTATAGYLAQTMDWMGVWTEALPAGHVAWLSAEPYALYRPIVRRRYVAAAASTIPRKMHHYERLR